MATEIVMRLLNPRTGEMECKVCGQHHWASLTEEGHYYRGSWQCNCKCKLSASKPSEKGGKAEQK